MKYKKTLELLCDVLDKHDGELSILQFNNLIACETDTSDEPTIARTVKSMKSLGLINVDQITQKILVNPNVKELRLAL